MIIRSLACTLFHVEGSFPAKADLPPIRCMSNVHCPARTELVSRPLDDICHCYLGFYDDHLDTQIPERDMVQQCRGASDDDLWRGVLIQLFHRLLASWQTSITQLI